jgi:hypothetical protein
VSGNSAAPKRYAPWLWLLLLFFCGRVIGQALVVFFHVSFLPPMNQWQSGLLPYPILLASQFLIILLLGKVAFDFTRGKGFFTVPSARFRRSLIIFGTIYFAGMILRYVISMSLHPDRRWIGGTIPIVFHCVLATFVLIVAEFHRRAPQR